MTDIPEAIQTACDSILADLARSNPWIRDLPPDQRRVTFDPATGEYRLSVELPDTLRIEADNQTIAPEGVALTLRAPGENP